MARPDFLLCLFFGCVFACNNRCFADNRRRLMQPRKVIRVKRSRSIDYAERFAADRSALHVERLVLLRLTLGDEPVEIWKASPARHAFEILDSMRGLAAVCVVLFHFSARADLPFLFPRGYLAVDFFFGLSGFVLTQAYAERLKATLDIATFIRQRLIRLLPILAPGVVIAVLLEFWRPNITSSGRHLLETALAACLGIFAIPWPFPTSLEQAIFPLNGVVWSLFFEILVSILFAFAVKSRALRGWALATSAVGGVGIVTYVSTMDSLSTMGPLLTTWPAGFPRVFFSFFVGVLLSQAHSRASGIRVPPGMIYVYFAAFAVIFSIPRMTATPDTLIDLACVMLVFPVLILSMANCRTPARFSKASSVAGQLSYPLYAVHYPIVRGVGYVILRHPMPTLARLGIVGLTMIGLVVLAWALFRYYDEPLRRTLTRRFVRRPILTPVHEATRIA